MRSFEQLTKEESRKLIADIIAKKKGEYKAEWADIRDEYDLDVKHDTLRKIGYGVSFCADAGMRFDAETKDAGEFSGYIERQKLYDLRRDIRKNLREESRSELIRETISEAVKNMPRIVLPDESGIPRNGNKELVVCIGDFHYGAKFEVNGIEGELINRYDSGIFMKRMTSLCHEIEDIVYRDHPCGVTLMIVGDMLDGMLRASQISRLEYGAVESAMRLAETMTSVISYLFKLIQIPITVYAVRGNHGEIRPLGSKAGQFPEENLERIVMHYLAARFEDCSMIRIPVADCPVRQVADIEGFRFLLFHGHDGDIEKTARESVNLYGKKIDYFICGHLHKSQTFMSGILDGGNSYVERVPSLCGIDPYAQSIGSGCAPGAVAMLIEKDYGRRCVYPIKFKE